MAARALYALNRFGEATGHGDRAVEIWDAHGSTPLELGEALLISARMRTLRADPDAARAKALQPWTSLSRSGPATPWPCATALCARRTSSRSAWGGGDLVAAGVGADPAGRRHDLVAHALGYRGLAKASVGDPSGVGDLKRAVETADRLDHGDYLTVAAHNLAVVLARSGRVREAKPYLDVAERAAPRRRRRSRPPGPA